MGVVRRKFRGPLMIFRIFQGVKKYQRKKARRDLRPFVTELIEGYYQMKTSADTQNAKIYANKVCDSLNEEQLKKMPRYVRKPTEAIIEEAKIDYLGIRDSDQLNLEQNSIQVIKKLKPLTRYAWYRKKNFSNL